MKYAPHVPNSGGSFGSALERDKVQALLPHFATDCLNLHKQAASLLLPLFPYQSKEGPGQDDLKSSSNLKHFASLTFMQLSKFGM